MSHARTTPPTQPHLQRRQLVLGALAFTASPWALAQAPLSPAASHATGPSTPAIQGLTWDGQPLALSDLRGQVVLVFHWATDCAVCRDKMHEMRANVAGWGQQPFRLLGVNWDTQRSELERYEKLVQQTIPPAQRLQSIWAGDGQYKSSLERPARLPMAQLIDKRGQWVAQYSGRIPAEAWDQIASLL